MNAFRFRRRGLVRICVVACADGRRVEWCRVGWKTGCEAKIEFGGAVPHAFYSGCEAVDGRVDVCFLHALDDSVGRVGARVRRMAAPAHEIGSGGVLGVVDGVADLASDVSEVATVALFGLRFAPFLDDPEEAKGDKGAGDEAREEAGGEGAAVEAGLRGDGCGGA
jgi:hypothetical protein